MVRVARWMVCVVLMVAMPVANHAAVERSTASVTGSATYRERVALSTDAVFEATLEDVSRSGAPSDVIVRLRKGNPGQVPIHFELSYPPERIHPSRTYVVRAAIRDGGRLRFTTDHAVPVLTQGHGSQVTIVLVAATRGGGTEPGAPREWRGMFRHQADAARFRDCDSRREWPVAMTGDYKSLERAYAARRAAPGAELLVALRGRIEQRPRMEGAGAEPTLVVEKFLNAMPGERCEGDRATSGLEDNRWRALAIGGHRVVVARNQHEPWIELDSRAKRVTGSGGCNRFSGKYQVGHGTLRFSQLVSTQMACPQMKTETAFLRALHATRKHRVRGRSLELIGAKGNVLVRLEEANLR